MKTGSTRPALPPGFELVSGTDSTGPFLISEDPVSNFEYLVYLEWLRHNFVDYPEIYENARPRSVDPGIRYPVNDPFTSAYLGHPAYSDYPVVGVNWEQAMDYCSWRTDRMNEAILISIGGLSFRKQFINSSNENNFQTEAFINGQFEFSEVPIKNQAFFHYELNETKTLWERPHDYYSAIKLNNADLYPSLFYGGRLPTEEEWDIYMQSGSTSTQRKSVDQSFVQLAELLDISAEMRKTYSRHPQNHNLKTQKNPVREWLLDTFSGFKRHHQSTEEKFLSAAMGKADLHQRFIDAYGSLLEKDSMGRFGFRIMGWQPSGEAITVHRYNYYGLKSFDMVPQEKSKELIDAITAIYINYRLDTFRIPGNRPDMLWFYGPKYIITSKGDQIRFLVNQKYYDIKMPFPFISVEKDLVFLQNDAEVLSYINGDNLTGKSFYGFYRITKNKNIRKSEFEKYGQNDLGFRMVLPWYGHALPKGFEW